ncbi:MAG: hypothetical protein MUE97_02820, partial [Phycisphaerales bacterium]|nr:hypothetical protein [Phycisphaerales bacterium]
MAKTASKARSRPAAPTPTGAGPRSSGQANRHSHEHPLRRLAALRKLMAKAEAPALLVTNPKDVG